MRTLTVHLAPLLIWVVTGFTGNTPHDNLPGRVVHDRDRPSSSAVWVPLSRSLDAAGQLRWDVLGQDAKENYEGVAANTPLEVTSTADLPRGKARYDLQVSGKLPDCVYYGPSYHDFAGAPRETIENLATSAEWSVRGHVTNITPGFFHGEPFSLLTVEVDRTLAITGKSPDPVLFVLYPYAHFRAGDISFCKDDYRFPHIPVVSDELLLFAPRGAVGVEVTLLMPDRNYVIFGSRDEITLPAELQDIDDLPRSIDAIAERIRALRSEIRK
jgi:hypothetical protein